jgi:hypothetical protein
MVQNASIGILRFREIEVEIRLKTSNCQEVPYKLDLDISLSTQILEFLLMHSEPLFSLCNKFIFTLGGPGWLNQLGWWIT